MPKCINGKKIQIDVGPAIIGVGIDSLQEMQAYDTQCRNLILIIFLRTTHNSHVPQRSPLWEYWVDPQRCTRVLGRQWKQASWNSVQPSEQKIQPWIQHMARPSHPSPTNDTCYLLSMYATNDHGFEPTWRLQSKQSCHTMTGAISPAPTSASTVSRWFFHALSQQWQFV